MGDKTKIVKTFLGCDDFEVRKLDLGKEGAGPK
jgi:hypothetical protein